MIKAQDIITSEAHAILDIPETNNYRRAVQFIYQQVHQKGGKVITSGVGKAGQIALNIATTFSSTGTPAVFLHPTEAQHGDLGVIQPNDVLLLISNSGKTTEILQLYELTHALWGNYFIPTVAITSDQNSELAEVADECLLTGNPKEVCPLGLSPTTSTTVMTVIGDILISVMTDRLGFTKEDYAKRHHAGYLGDKARGTGVSSERLQHRVIINDINEVADDLLDRADEVTSGLGGKRRWSCGKATGLRQGAIWLKALAEKLNRGKV